MSDVRLSQGLSFPFRFDYRTGGPQMSTSDDHEHIKESIRQILGTRIGERFMRPDFGSRLHELVFKGNDAVLRGLIKHHVVEAISRWEKRVVVTGVKIDESTKQTGRNELLVIVNYRIDFTRSTGSVVHQFAWRLEPN